jgi:hypothetical protein
MGGQTFRVFISAVTSELGPERREVARLLRRKNLTVRDQDYFRPGPGTLLDKLEAYIAECDAVIFLIGAKSGFMSQAAEAATSAARPTYETYRQASGASGASYTQWEYLLARHHGRDCYVFVADKELAPTSDCDADQRNFRQWLAQEGKDWSSFTSKEKLREDVLVLDFPTLNRVIPDNLPFQPLGSLFKGREAAMDALENKLKGPPGTVITAALHGLGGVGKTRLAVEYTHDHRADYTALLFLIAETPESLSRTLADLAAILDLPQKDAREDEVKIDAVLNWLAANPGWLLILDNVDDEKAAKAAGDLVAKLRGGHVLITARFSKFKPGVHKIELDTLEPSAAAAYLCEATDSDRVKSPDDEAQALKLATELDGFAVALEQASAYIAAQRIGFARYLNIWAEKRAEVLDWHDESLMNYPKSVAATWLASMEHLSLASRALLYVFAWFAPDPIPDALMDVPLLNGEEQEERAALSVLFSYSLAKREQDAAIVVHRLVQTIVLDQQTKDLIEEPPIALVAAIGWINLAFVGEFDDARNWSRLDPLVPHVLAIVNAADKFANGNVTAATLSNNLGLLFLAKARYAQAEPLLRRALGRKLIKFVDRVSKSALA